MSNIKDLLRSWEEYSQLNFNTPYIYSIEKGDQTVTYFGAKHTFDPTDAQFQQLDGEWTKFLSHTGKKAAIGEGSRRRPLKETKEDAIRAYGEQGYLRYLTNASSVDLYHPDPAEDRIWKELENVYSFEELFYHDAAQIAYQWSRTDRLTSFEEYYEPYLERLRSYFPQKAHQLTFKNLLVIHNNSFKTAFNPTDAKFFSRLQDPSRFDSRYNELGRAADVVRDTTIISKILELWQTGHSIFVVMGSGHAVIQERALKKLLG